MNKHFLIVVTLLLCTTSSVSARECWEKPGAAVLPFTVTGKGEVKILLAYDTRGFWSSLGGGRKYIISANNPTPRCETSQETAVREGWEESRYLLSQQLLAAKIASAATLPLQAKETDFVTYVFKVKELSLAPFYESYVIEGSSSAETASLFWADLSELVEFAKNERSKLATPNNKPLRPLFWQSLKKYLVGPEVSVFKK